MCLFRHHLWLKLGLGVFALTAEGCIQGGVKRREGSETSPPVYWIHFNGTFIYSQSWFPLSWVLHIPCPQLIISFCLSISTLFFGPDVVMTSDAKFLDLSSTPDLLSYHLFIFYKSVLIYKVHWLWNQEHWTWVQPRLLIYKLTEQILISKMKAILTYSFSKYLPNNDYVSGTIFRYQDIAMKTKPAKTPPSWALHSKIICL